MALPIEIDLHYLDGTHVQLKPELVSLAIFWTLIYWGKEGGSGSSFFIFFLKKTRKIEKKRETKVNIITMLLL